MDLLVKTIDLLFLLVECSTGYLAFLDNISNQLAGSVIMVVGIVVVVVDDGDDDDDDDGDDAVSIFHCIY